MRFTNSELTVASGAPYSFVRRLRVIDKDLRLSVDTGAAAEIYTIGPDLRIKDLSQADRYWVVHRQMELEGKIGHPAEKCPFRTQPRELFLWDAANGWQTAAIRSTLRDVTSK